MASKQLSDSRPMEVECDGLTIVPDVLDLADISALIGDFEHSELPRSRAGIRHLLRHRSVGAVANDSRMLGLAQQVLGSDAFPFRATLFDKSPDTNWLITWHQDTALPLREKHQTPGWGPWSVKDGVIYAHAPASALEQVVALRLHLDDSTEENGPLRVMPGTHSRGVLTDAEVESIVAGESPVTCTVGKGGVIVMRPLIIHASSKSQSDIPRRVLHVEYATPQAVSSPLALAIA